MDDRFVWWKDKLLRRLLGFSPFELQDEVRRLRKLVDDLRRQHAEEVAALRKTLAEAGVVLRGPLHLRVGSN